MCGIFGYSGPKNVTASDIRLGLLINESRGSHSTGVFGKQLAKSAVAAKEFIKMPNFDDVVASKQVLAHCRFATVGEKTNENAHPFRVGQRLVGTHNGSLVNHEMVAKKYGLEVPAVDSKFIFQLLEHKDFDPKAIMELEGWMAIAYVFDGKLHLYRRDNRPLFIGNHKKGVYYSSIKDALTMIGCKDAQELEPNRMVVFQDGDMIQDIDMGSPKLSIPEHATSFSWRNLAKGPVEEVVPLAAKPFHSQPSWEDDEARYERRFGYNYGGGHIKHVKTTGSYQEGNKEAQKNNAAAKELKVLDIGSLEVAQLKDSFLECYGNEKLYTLPEDAHEEDKTRWKSENFGRIIIKAIDSEDRKPVTGWMFQVYGDDRWVYTTNTGNTIITVPNNDLGKPIRVVGKYPSDTGGNFLFVTKLFTIRAGDVLEVTLLIPFQKQAEKKETDGNGITCTLPTSNDGKVVQPDGQTRNLPVLSNVSKNQSNGGNNSPSRNIGSNNKKKERERTPFCSCINGATYGSQKCLGKNKEGELCIIDTAKPLGGFREVRPNEKGAGGANRFEEYFSEELAKENGETNWSNDSWQVWKKSSLSTVDDFEENSEVLETEIEIGFLEELIEKACCSEGYKEGSPVLIYLDELISQKQDHLDFLIISNR
jgi:hypothetical protein